jgi:NifU-like protein involved in Fe-S cluster formation
MDAIYTPSLLELAANIPRIGRLPDPHGVGSARSMVCGSEVEVSVMLDTEGRIADLGLEVEACALGQASAAILARSAVGAHIGEVTAARDALADFLTRGGAAPTGRFADLSILAPAVGYPRRHASVQLAFRAAVDAMLQAEGHLGAQEGGPTADAG